MHTKKGIYREKLLLEVKSEIFKSFEYLELSFVHIYTTYIKTVPWKAIH